MERAPRGVPSPTSHASIPRCDTPVTEIPRSVFHRTDGTCTEDRRPHGGLFTRNRTDMLTSFEFASAWLQARCQTDRGASLVEYALLVALIAVVCIIAVTVLGGNASKKFSSVGSAIG